MHNTWRFSLVSNFRSIFWNTVN